MCRRIARRGDDVRGRVHAAADRGQVVLDEPGVQLAEARVRVENGRCLIDGARIPETVELKPEF